MTFESVANRYNGPKLEQEILAFWEDQAIFQQSIALSKDKPRFSFNEGPPTANGKPGIHHVLARTFKDVYPRYKTMQGFYAPRKGGWDTHGLPVEHEIEKQLGIYDKTEIEEKVGIAEFTRRCRESVMTYIKDWETMTQRMGYWVNLDEAYYTLDNNYIESVWNILKRIWDKDLIYKGYKVVPYDPRIGATLSSHEVAQGYKEVEDPSITVRFKLKDEDNTYFLVWTTTPWTLPANQLLAVRDDIEYSYIDYQGDTLIMASSLVGQLFEPEQYRIIKTVKGEALTGLRYEQLFDYLTITEGSPFQVVNADFVSEENGTGIVHIAPAYGVDDLAIGLENGLAVVHGVGLDGYMVDAVTPVAGKFFKDADPVLIELLIDRDMMVKNDTMLHNYPFGWRTGDPLIYYAKEAWYIKTTAVKDRMVELNQNINWTPETIKDGRFGNWLENNIDWALSRERFWGTPLPLWTDGENYRCIGSLEELEQLVGRKLDELDLHRPAIDDITFVIEGREYRRVPEVIDCWFDSGAMPYAQWHYPFENKKEFKAHSPADYICEAIDQTRGWFYTLHAVATLVDDDLAYKNCICLSHIVDEQGKKMSKSKGNILDPYAVFDSVGVDSLRWLFLARSAPEGQKRISVDIVREVAASFVNTLWNTYAFFVLYANLDDIDFSNEVALDERPDIDRWIIALTHQTLQQTTEALDRFDAFSAGKAIESLVDQLSNWYIRRNRRRFWKSESGSDKQAAYLTLYECLDTITRMIAPFMPFFSEALYQNLAKADPNAAASVHHTVWPQYDSERIDETLIFEMQTLQNVIGLGRGTREHSKIRVRQPLSRLLVSCPSEKSKQAILKHQGQLLDELNIKSIEFIDSDQDLIQYQIKPIFTVLGKKYGKLMPKIKAALESFDASTAISNLEAGEPFQLDVDGQLLDIGVDEVEIQSTSKSGFSSLSENNFTVALDTQINDVLYLEGLAREVVRSIQDARKSADFDIADFIELSVQGSDKVIEALNTHKDYILSETLCKTLSDNVPSPDYHLQGQLDDENWQIALRRIA